MALNLGASETIANLVGLLSGTAVATVVGLGTNALDKRFNLSGYHVTQPKVTHTESFDNWDDMKSAHEGEVTQFVRENKPTGSPTLKKWFENGGSVTIDTLDDGTQIWTYTNSAGQSVPYIDGHVSFPEQYLHPDSNISRLNIGSFSDNRGQDIEAAMRVLNEYGYTRVPSGYILHHSMENGIIQLVQANIHSQFSHYGGFYYFNLGGH